MGKMKNFLMEQQEQMLDAGARFLVIYSVKLDPYRAVMVEYLYKSGDRFFFPCFSDCKDNVEIDARFDLLHRMFGSSGDVEDYDLTLASAGVYLDSFTILQVLDIDIMK